MAALSGAWAWWIELPPFAIFMSLIIAFPFATWGLYGLARLIAILRKSPIQKSIPSNAISLEFSEDPFKRWEIPQKYRFTGLIVMNNNKETSAHNVQVTITDIVPRPSFDRAFQPHFPFHLRPLNEQKANNYTINPETEKVFVLSRAWIGGSNEQPYIDIDNSRDDGRSNYIMMQTHECWQLSVLVSSSNAGTTKHELIVRVEEGYPYIRIK